MSSKTIPDIAAEIFRLLEPLDSSDRHRVIGGALAMLGESVVPTTGVQVTVADDPPLGPRAARWVSQHGLTTEQLEHVFHFGEDGSVDVLDGVAWGDTKKARTVSTYLLLGASRLLEDDSPKFQDADATALCKRFGCHDSANHAKNRDSLGNWVNGSKKAGVALTTPGLAEAAKIVKKTSGQS